MYTLPLPSSDGLRQIGESVMCSDGGYAVMIRMSRVADMAWFQEGADAFVKTNKYKQLCYVAQRIHGVL